MFGATCSHTQMRTLLGLFVAALIPIAAAQSPDTGTWENASFGPEGPAVGGSLVSAMAAAPNGDVFASGYFETIGGTLANSVARFPCVAQRPPRWRAACGSAAYRDREGPGHRSLPHERPTRPVLTRPERRRVSDSHP